MYNKEYLLAYNKTERGKEVIRRAKAKYRSKPENQTKMKEYRQRPEVKKRQNENQRMWKLIPTNKLKIKEYRNNPIFKQKNLQRQRKYDLNRKTSIMTHYGGKCACCDESRLVFLTLDHINGGGTKHSKSLGGKLYRWIIKNNYPLGFQVLCFNCNWAKSHGGCPHSKGLNMTNNKVI